MTNFKTHNVLVAVAAFLRCGLFNETWSYRLWRWLGKSRGGKIFWIPLLKKNKKLWLAGVHGKTDALINLSGLTNKPFELALSLMEKKPPFSILDIGANVGQSLLLVKSYGNFPVVCYEPSPICAKILKLTVDKNRFQKVKIKNTALGKKNGILRLYGYSDFDSNASVVPGFRKNTTQSFSVKVTTLDQEKEGVAIPPRLIKIDVEGGEWEVLLGSQKTLRKYRPILCVETLYTKNPEHKKRQLQVALFLKKNRYQTFHFQDGKGLKRCQNMCGDPRYRNNDYLCFPKEKTRSFLNLIKKEKLN